MKSNHNLFKVMKDIRKAVTRGYGDINATGINQEGKIQTIKSSKDAAYSQTVKENISTDDFIKESRNMIKGFVERFLNRPYVEGDAR